MTTIVFTTELLRKTHGLTCPMEFRDQQDHLFGTYQPSGEKLTYDQMEATCPYPLVEEELNHRELDSAGGRPLADILHELEEKWPANAPGQIVDSSNEYEPMLITVTPELLQKLHGLISPMEFRDEEGRLLGKFQPSGEKLTYDQMMATCPYTEEELAEMAKSPSTGKSTTEILNELKKKWPIK